MYLKCHTRYKDGKEHRYWSVAERVTGASGRRFERHVLYLGELGSQQRDAWALRTRQFEGADDGVEQTLLFPADRLAAEAARATVGDVRIRLAEFSVRRPRQWGACWAGCRLWDMLGLDDFWQTRLPRSRKGTRWLDVLKTLCVNRLVEPSSEWRVHREWFLRTAMADLLGCGPEVAAKDTLYRCLDKVLPHKDALFRHLRERWAGLFGARFDILLYDLTSTYFESDPPFPAGDKRRHGYSRDHRSDCVQVVVALVVTPEGFPIAYEVMPGNTADNTTLAAFLDTVERLHGKARRIWLMDRGIPTEETLAELRRRGGQYVVGTPKGRLTKLADRLAERPWHEVRDNVKVKLLPDEGEVVVYVESADRVGKERAMRQRRTRKLLARLAKLAERPVPYEDLLQKIGAARHEAGRDSRHVRIELPAPPPDRKAPVTFAYRLDRDTIRRARRREGRYLLRSNLTRHDPGELWLFYLRLGEVEQAFRTLKGDLGLRPVFHQVASRIEAHILVAFLAYSLHVTLKTLLSSKAPGLTSRSALEKLGAIQMLDVHFPTTDGRELVFLRHTQPEPDQRLVLDALGWTLPPQPPPTITTQGVLVQR